MKETSACGPLQSVIKRPVEGTFFGLVLNSKTEQGFTEELTPYLNKDGEIQEYLQIPLADGSGYKLFGHQVTQYSAIIGISGARNIAIGTGGSQGSWGQGGLGTSSSNQQLVTTIELRLCEVGTVIDRKPPPPPLPVIAKVHE